MQAFKSLFSEHFIFKRNNLITNSDASLYADLFSVEEGGGIQINYLGYSSAISVCSKVEKVCKPELLSKFIRRFNKQ